MDRAEAISMIRFPEPVADTEDQVEFPWRDFAKEYNSFLEPKVPGHAEKFGVRYWEYAVILSVIKFGAGDIVIDIGGGFCFFMLYLSTKIRRGYVVDRGTWRNYDMWLDAMHGLEDVQSGKIEIFTQDAKHLPFEANSIDVAITISALEHNAPPNDSDAVREVWRVLKPGGLFLGTVDFNPKTERPIAWSDDYTYTWQSFNSRILEAAPFELIGDISEIPSDLESYKPGKLNVALFFGLRKKLDAKINSAK